MTDLGYTLKIPKELVGSSNFQLSLNSYNTPLEDKSLPCLNVLNIPRLLANCPMYNRYSINALLIFHVKFEYFEDTVSEAVIKSIDFITSLPESEPHLYHSVVV